MFYSKKYLWCIIVKNFSTKNCKFCFLAQKSHFLLKIIQKAILICKKSKKQQKILKKFVKCIDFFKMYAIMINVYSNVVFKLNFYLFFWNLSKQVLICFLKSKFPGGSAGKESACNAGDLGSIPGLGRSPGEGKGYPLQYSGLENSMDCVVHGVTKNWTRLTDFHSLTFFIIILFEKKKFLCVFFF